ncbi:zinc metalloprotease [Actinomadura sp. ATCC 31491]|uniref:Zinc metalloprotease n=1 Tax=Actinomadura luzonensis TaxID=2805427 RepID=A0ABT0GAM6_9ACTN|nr:zinc metalloprotease [Actinomadura luzonensis]MCK2221660.1 zinc metalloprotease [Actinomadura luzonensis]
MTRRATAVSSACLLAVALAPPAASSAAVPALRAACAATPSGGSPALPGRFRERARAGAATSAPGPRSPQPQDVSFVAAELGRRLAGVTPPTKITVPTRVHVLTRGHRKVSDQDIRSQIAVLNAAYGGAFGGADTGVRFHLESIAVKDEPAWFADPVGAEQAMKTALHKGGRATLNLYIAQLSELMLGFASYPYWYEGAPKLDGVVIDWRSLPGGPMTNYNRGFTAVHEIGHWLGLFHTFENGCAEPGDGIDDTPAEATATEACPAEKDTCGQPGHDPMRNFMDYAHDRCMAEFTAGQARRMQEMWAAYRNIPEK